VPVAVPHTHASSRVPAHGVRAFLLVGRALRAERRGGVTVYVVNSHAGTNWGEGCGGRSNPHQSDASQRDPSGARAAHTTCNAPAYDAPACDEPACDAPASERSWLGQVRALWPAWPYLPHT
jgi:hypothetical protein